MANRDPGEELWTEVGKGLIQVVVVGVLGTVLTMVADLYRTKRERADKERDDARARVDKERDLERSRAEAAYEFRMDKHRRLVKATNALRLIPIMIEANRSVKTWSEQMVAAIGVGFELRAIQHEISASAGTPFPPISETALIDTQFKAMLAYTQWLADDFRESKKELSNQQEWAEEKNLDVDERARRQRAVWNAIITRPPVADMLGRAPGEAAGEVSWDSYEVAYRAVLQELVQASFGARGGDQDAADGR
jgi:hypothetical protein